MKTSFGQPANQRGLALVETAICLPVLLLVLLGAGEVTNAFMDHNTLTKAVRDGARHASGKVINHGSKVFDLNATLVNETRRLVVYGNTAGNGAPVLPNLSVGNVSVTNAGNEIVQVNATYAYTGILGTVLPSFGFGSNTSLTFNLQATVQMRGL